MFPAYLIVGPFADEEPPFAHQQRSEKSLRTGGVAEKAKEDLCTTIIRESGE
jgi:hypothetical protein